MEKSIVIWQIYFRIKKIGIYKFITFLINYIVDIKFINQKKKGDFMEKETKESKLKKIGLLIIILVIILIISMVVCIILLKKNTNSNCSEISELEKIATYNYLENDFFNVNELYILSSDTSEDEVKIYQYQTQFVLDDYFESHPDETSVSEETIRGLLKDKFGTQEDVIDFHGIIATGYIYNDIELNFTKDTAQEENIFDYEYEELITSHSDDRVFVEKIEKNSDNSYTIYLDIVNGNDTSITRENYKEKSEISGKAKVKIIIDNNNLKIESCTIE